MAPSQQQRHVESPFRSSAKVRLKYSVCNGSSIMGQRKAAEEL
jgi:hypothetical protein